MTKLELLYAQKSEKFSELCAVVARELGYGELSTPRVSPMTAQKTPDGSFALQNTGSNVLLLALN